MKGGEIYGNHFARSSTVTGGGGVYVESGTFRIINGTVYGSNEGAKSNTCGVASGATLGGFQTWTAQRGIFLPNGDWYTLIKSPLLY
jgi:hypothetical protein